MFSTEKRFPHLGHLDSIHTFQTFNNFKKDLDSELKRKGIAPNPYLKAPPVKDYVLNKKEIFNRIQTKLIRYNPKMKLSQFVDEEDRKYVVGESFVEPRLRFHPDAYDDFENYELIQNRSYSQPKSFSISRDASRISRPYGQSPEPREPLWKPRTAQSQLRKITSEEMYNPPRNVKTAATTSKSSQKEYLNRSDIGSRKNSSPHRDITTPSDGGVLKNRILNDSLFESHSQLEIQHDNNKSPSLTDIGPVSNNPVQNPSRNELKEAKHPNTTQAHLPPNFETLSTAAKFEVLYQHYKNPLARGGASSSPHDTRNVRRPAMGRAKSAEKKPSRGKPNLRSASGMKLGEVAENAEEDNVSIQQKPRASKQLTFGDENDSAGEEASRDKKRGTESAMHPIRRKFEREIKLELNKKFEVSSKAMKGKLQLMYDKLNRKLDYLEMKAHKIKPRKYDFEDYLKTLYGQDVTLKDYIAIQIKHNASQKQKDQEVIQLTEFLKAQNSLVEPEAHNMQQTVANVV